MKKFKKRREHFQTYKKKLDENSDSKTEFELFMNVMTDKGKPSLGRYIQREYVDKIMTYGYVLVCKYSFNWVLNLFILLYFLSCSHAPLV